MLFGLFLLSDSRTSLHSPTASSDRIIGRGVAKPNSTNPLTKEAKSSEIHPPLSDRIEIPLVSRLAFFFKTTISLDRSTIVGHVLSRFFFRDSFRLQSRTPAKTDLAGTASVLPDMETSVPGVLPVQRN